MSKNFPGWTKEKVNELQEKGKIKGVTVQEKGRKKMKYFNEKVLYEGMMFDSKKECARWKQLKLLLKAGKIGLLERQVEFPLETNGERVGKYIADFRYYDHELATFVVEDVKSPATRKLSTYRLKKKMVLAQYGYEIKEI